MDVTDTEGMPDLAGDKTTSGNSIEDKINAQVVYSSCKSNNSGRRF